MCIYVFNFSLYYSNSECRYIYIDPLSAAASDSSSDLCDQEFCGGDDDDDDDDDSELL